MLSSMRARPCKGGAGRWKTLTSQKPTWTAAQTCRCLDALTDMVRRRRIGSVARPPGTFSHGSRARKRDPARDLTPLRP